MFIDGKLFRFLLLSTAFHLFVILGFRLLPYKNISTHKKLNISINTGVFETRNKTKKKFSKKHSSLKSKKDINKSSVPISKARSIGKISNPAPEYPDEAREWGWEGKVRLKIYISRTGEPINTEIIESSGFPILDNAAIDTVVNSWKFPVQLSNIIIIKDFVFQIK